MIPDWLLGHVRIALLGEIYQQIRMIAVRYEKDKKTLLIRYYLDREPTEFDYESIEMVAVELDASLGEHSLFITAINVECIFSEDVPHKLDPLDGVFYARREYDMQDNPE